MSSSKQRKRVAPMIVTASPSQRRSEKLSRKIEFSSSSSDEVSDDEIEVVDVVKSPSTETLVARATMGDITSKSPAKERVTPTPTKKPTPSKKSPKNPDPEPDSEAEEEEDVDENDLAPTLEDLSSQCWKCYVTLKMPQSPSSTNSDENFCYYALHVHPLLNVPICSVCVRELTDSPQDDEVCHGCASSGDMLFVCDECPRTFCKTCVAQAYGGGRKGHQKIRDLEEDDGAWQCPACDPQPLLKALQKDLEPDRDGEDDINDNNNKPKKSVEEILHQLDMVEKEKSRNQQEWDDPETVQAKREEIAAEIRAEKPQLSEKKLDLLVKEEMQVLETESTKHDDRLGDLVTSLQEELEVVHGLDLAKVYDKCLGEEQQKAGEDSTEPEWKRQADAEISKRMAERPHREIQNVFSPSVYQRETFEEVEDLMTKQEDERDCPGDGFRSTQCRPSQRQIEEAIETENEVLQKLNVKIRQQVDNTMDEQEMFQEEQLTSQHGSGVVVRRDTIMGLAEMKVRRKRIRPKPVHVQLPAEDEEEVPAAAAALPGVPKKEAATPQLSANAGKTATDAVDLTDETETPVMTQKSKAAPTAAAAGVKKELFGTKPPNFKRVEYLEIDDDDDEEEAAARKKPTDEDEYYCPEDPVYVDSDVVLSSPEIFHSTSGRRVKTIKVSTQLTQYLKPHQKEGVQFMWRNACVDYNVRTSRDEEVHEEKDVGGCILAHSMGLGKSLTAITLMYTLMNHPGLQCKEGKGLVHTIMLVVPVNTIASWKAEFGKWTRKLEPSVLIYSLADHNTHSREHVIGQWISRGGVLLVSKDSFQKMVNKHPTLHNPGPDAVVVDEAHQCLSNRANAIYRALEGIKTKRRLLLTGSPFQNNALEYYRMVHWMRKNILDESEAAFERDFARPINAGMPSDAPPAAIAQCALKSKQLNNILSPYVHRKDATVLRESLPPMQQVIIHVRQSKWQTNLYKELRRYEQRHDITSFFSRYHLSRPIHNHPACLLMQSQSDDPDVKELEIEDGLSIRRHKNWWKNFAVKKGLDKMTAVSNGPKLVLLLHILSHSVKIGDKVVLFSQCLKTLDFIEQVLQMKCWSDKVKSLKHEFPDMKLGGWTKGVEYLRIDGAIDSGKRGDLINRFNKAESKPSERVQLFLISTRAGGIGITLTAANRVVLFDSHFNPVIMNQALFRCYRFGQTKPVFAYRFLTEGTSEEKVYTRSVNKTGLALRVIDNKNFKGMFTEKELSNMELNDTWAQCDRCEKWRMLKGEDEEDLPDKWFCEMNTHDAVNNNCDASEKDNRWYHQQFQLTYVSLGSVGDGNSGNVGGHQYTIAANADATTTPTVCEPNPVECGNKEALAQKDVILSKLLNDSGDQYKGKKTKPSAIISKFYFQESVLACEDMDVMPNSGDTESSGAAASDGDLKLAGDLTPAARDGDLKPAAKVHTAPSDVAAEVGKQQEKASEKQPVKAVESSKKAATETDEKACTTIGESTSKQSIKTPPPPSQVDTTPKAAKGRKRSSSESTGAQFSVTKVPRASASASKALPPNKSGEKSVGKSTGIKPSPSVARSTASAANKVAVKESPSIRGASSNKKPAPSPSVGKSAASPANRVAVNESPSIRGTSSNKKPAPSPSVARSAASADKVAVKESPSARGTSSATNKNPGVAVKESPLTRATSSSLTNQDGVVTRFSPRLKKQKSHAPESTKKPAKKRKSEDSNSGSGSARRRLDISPEPKKDSNKSARKRSPSPKPKQKQKQAPAKSNEIVIELLDSSDEE